MKKDFQRLKAALELSVRDILAEVGAETGCNFTAESSATISELVLEKSVRSASDLQAFAAHAKRQSVTAEDVRLLTRRNPELVSKLIKFNCEHFFIFKIALYVGLGPKMVHNVQDVFFNHHILSIFLMMTLLNSHWISKTTIPQNARLTALTKEQGESSGLKKTAVKPRRGGKAGGSLFLF